MSGLNLQGAVHLACLVCLDWILGRAVNDRPVGNIELGAVAAAGVSCHNTVAETLGTSHKCANVAVPGHC